jgi:lipoyl(octanoyl) transferase
MSLEILPVRTAGAAENMATDFLLLQRYPKPAVARFRHYGWHGPAWTFGYSQKIAFIRSQLPADTNANSLCRRVTGGGIVDHGDDWTYALVIPRGLALEELRATESYRRVHECLAAVLRAQGVPAIVKTQCEPPADPELGCGPAGVCFQRAELYDIVHETTGEKVAGAAQKRNKHGLLFQGSLARPVVGHASIDWENLPFTFAAALAVELGVEAQPVPWPDFNEDEASNLTEHYGSTEWIAYR